MKRDTLAALKRSIKKWEGIATGRVIDQGAYNCPLCRMFYDYNCRGCPVFESTGFAECDRTPYRNRWVKVAGDGHTADTKTREAAARAELKFLLSLLPKSKTRKAA